MGINVFLNASHMDAPIIAAVMASICSNTKSTLNFYIIDGFLSYRNKQKINECSRFFNNFTTEYIRLDLKPWMEKYPELVKFDRRALIKYVIPSLKPDLDRAIIIDNDIVFLDKSDIENLYKIELNENLIAATPLATLFSLNINNGVWTRQRLLIYKKLEISSTDVFDPGLLVVDVRRWNAEKITDKVLETTVTLTCKHKLFNCYDGLFKFLNGQYHKLDKSWNVPYHYAKIFYFGKEFNLDEMKVIHYNYTADINKPWNNKYIEGAEYFWKYVDLTPFKRQLEKKPPSIVHDPNYWASLKYRRKAINLIIQCLVSRKRYQKLKKHAEQFFADSKSSFIRLLGEIYF